nr:MAG TPA: hypothetical protein [Caudoviricetes sp.]
MSLARARQNVAYQSKARALPREERRGKGRAL